MGFEEPTPIQEKTIPVLLAGRDVIGQAQTGTGKTAAFGIPIVEKMDRHNFAVQALILAPTRELAIQAAEEMNKLGAFKRLHALPVYGGTSIERQIKALKKGAQIVVGTPGRVLDHIQRKTLSLKDVKIAVLDEADEMLDMGFLDDINRILAETPKERQTLLFSATMPEAILKISKRYMNSPEKIKIASDSLTAPKINQIFYEVRNQEKIEALTRLIDSDDSGRFLIFCHTKKEADDVSSDLRLRGYDAASMHGDFTQQQREAVLKSFKGGRIDVLVATDVAARGLDISDISHVINYSIPQDPESYVHRIGRTGRAGK
ncbi:MAG: DEAD/DEAH box helicase, partial [Deltaproteobacteria bacterium]|nr:DEAD/DEAH box helicase [Deltaproteobacteria bacterium]